MAKIQVTSVEMRSKAQVIVLNTSFVAKAIKAKCQADNAREYFPQPDECAEQNYQWERLNRTCTAIAPVFDFLDELAEALLDEEKKDDDNE